LERISIEDYIDNNVTKKVLSRQLGAVNMYELERNDGMRNLIEFVRQSFNAHYNGRDNEKIKNLDHITKNLRIPSRSGSNLVNDLNLSVNVNSNLN
jgi:hypothetical protein